MAPSSGAEPFARVGLIVWRGQPGSKVKMKSQRECMAKAGEMERRALASDAESDRTEWDAMAKTWRWLAGQAAWQDRWALAEGQRHSG